MRLGLALLAALVLAAPAAAANTLASVDVSAYPQVRATLVTSRPTGAAPRVTENGQPVVGLEARNLGRAKSIVLAVDRSRSMAGGTLAQAGAAARAFVRAKPASDRIAVVAFGSRAVQSTGFSTARFEANAALGSLAVDRVQGTALYDAVELAAQALAADTTGGRVLVLLTDGDDVSSAASLRSAIDAAREASVSVYPIGLESKSFDPEPLRRLATETGGRYSGTADANRLAGVYASLAAELRRTWQLSYVTSVRPGERFEVAAAGARAEALAPGVPTVVDSGGSALPGWVFGPGTFALALFVGGCVLAGALLASRAPAGARLRKRLEPHLGEQKPDPRGGRVQERFQTASTLMQATEKAFGNLAFWARLHSLIERADLPLRTVELVYACAGSALLLGLVFAVGGAPPLLILGAFALGGAAPILVVSFKAKRRLTAIDDQLPEVLTTLAASLKAGHSFRQGIQAVVDEGDGPASREFNRVLTETQLGRPMDSALAEMADRVGSKNLKFVVTAVTIQRQVGGSMAGIFDMVADAVRNRQQFARKIRSLTAMGRMSAYVLMGIPFFLLAMITLINKDYMDPLYHTSLGHKLMLMGAVMMVVGSLVLRKIVSFRG
jgi:tight adherence protein B